MELQYFTVQQVGQLGCSDDKTCSFKVAYSSAELYHM